MNYQKGDYQKRAVRDMQDNIDRHDPAKVVESLRRQGAKITRIQAWTYIWEDAEQLARFLRTSPEISTVLINLTRASIKV